MFNKTVTVHTEKEFEDDVLKSVTLKTKGGRYVELIEYGMALLVDILHSKDPALAKSVVEELYDVSYCRGKEPFNLYEFLESELNAAMNSNEK